MKTRKKISLGIISSILLFNLFILIPKISVASSFSLPDQFIGEIFPNCTSPLRLLQTNTLIKFNATDFPHSIGFDFDANYTIYNPANVTTIPIILPFSFETNISDFNIEVYTNNTQITHNLFIVSPWNENITEIDIHLAGFIEVHPIILIRSNLTIQENSTSVIRYYIRGLMKKPVGVYDIFYLVYHIGTSQNWVGNTTGRVEIKAYGKQPVFGIMGFGDLNPRVEDIIEGRACITEWNNTISPDMDIGVQYYREDSPSKILMEYILYYISPFIGITTIFIIIIIKRKKGLNHSSKREVM